MHTNECIPAERGLLNLYNWGEGISCWLELIFSSELWSVQGVQLKAEPADIIYRPSRRLQFCVATDDDRFRGTQSRVCRETARRSAYDTKCTTNVVVVGSALWKIRLLCGGVILCRNMREM